MPIEYQKWITRQDLRANPTKLYVFGDNLVRRGYGGQAREMRGEPNAIGIPTKYSPEEYLNDITHYEQVVFVYGVKFMELAGRLRLEQTLVFPVDGLGTGLADMQNRAPICWALLQTHLTALKALDKKLNESSN